MNQCHTTTWRRSVNNAGSWYWRGGLLRRARVAAVLLPALPLALGLTSGRGCRVARPRRGQAVPLQMEVIPSAHPWAGLSQRFQAQRKSVGAKPRCGARCVRSCLCLKATFVRFAVTLNLSLEMSAR